MNLYFIPFMSSLFDSTSKRKNGTSRVSQKERKNSFNFFPIKTHAMRLQPKNGFRSVVVKPE